MQSKHAIDYSKAMISDVEKREIVRKNIERDAGDPLSLMGTLADVAQMLLVWHCELVEASKTATTVAQLKAAIANTPLGAETARLLADNQAGTNRWPYELKTSAQVIDDVEKRATATYDAIAAGAQAKL